MKAIVSTRRGRPKSIAAPHENGRDLGTQELQLKRAMLAQGTDPAAATHPLDLLLARGLIGRAEHRAAWRYASLYRRVIGRTEVSYGRLYDGLRGEDGQALRQIRDEDGLRLAQQHFRLAQTALRSEGPVVAGITERLAVYGAWPDWLLQPVATTHRDLDLLRRGLGRLVAALRMCAANDNEIPAGRP